MTIEETVPAASPPVPSYTLQVGNEKGNVLVLLGAPREVLCMPPEHAMELAAAIMKHARRAGYSPRVIVN